MRLEWCICRTDRQLHGSGGRNRRENADCDMRAMGIDVSLVRRLDVVVLSDIGQIEYGPVKADIADISAVLRDAKPDVVAIDSPPKWGTNGKSRIIERQLRKLGINVYSCPQDPG